MSSINVPNAVWNLAQQLSGLKNPASFLRNDVLIPWAMNHANNSHCEPNGATNLDTPEVDDLLRRKTRLNCVDNSFDQNFTTAWKWAVDQFGGERTLVEFLEDQVSLTEGRMTNPRGVIIARWRSATTPGRRG